MIWFGPVRCFRPLHAFYATAGIPARDDRTGMKKMRGVKKFRSEWGEGKVPGKMDKKKIIKKRRPPMILSEHGTWACVSPEPGAAT